MIRHAWWCLVLGAAVALVPGTAFAHGQQVIPIFLGAASAAYLLLCLIVVSVVLLVRRSRPRRGHGLALILGSLASLVYYPLLPLLTEGVPPEQALDPFFMKIVFPLTAVSLILGVAVRWRAGRAPAGT